MFSFTVLRIFIFACACSFTSSTVDIRDMVLDKLENLSLNISLLNNLHNQQKTEIDILKRDIEDLKQKDCPTNQMQCKVGTFLLL